MILKESPRSATFNFNFPKQNQATTRITDFLEEDVDEKYYMSDDKVSKLVNKIENNEKNNESETDIIKVLDIPKQIHNDNERQRRVYSIEGISPTVLARQDTPKILLVGYLDMKAGKQVRSVYDPKGISPTIDTAQGGHRQTKILSREEQYRIRKLTPLECLRMQGFPISYYQKLRAINMSNTQLYKQAGNAVTTNVIESIALQLNNHFK